MLRLDETRAETAMPGNASSASHSSRRHTLSEFAHTARTCDGDAEGVAEGEEDGEEGRDGDRGSADADSVITGRPEGRKRPWERSSTAESKAGGGDLGESLKPRPLTRHKQEVDISQRPGAHAAGDPFKGRRTEKNTRRITPKMSNDGKKQKSCFPQQSQKKYKTKTITGPKVKK